MPTFYCDDGEEPEIGPPGIPSDFDMYYPNNVLVRETEKEIVSQTPFWRTDCVGNPVPIGHEPATEKQISLARWIGSILGIALPLANSKSIYSRWISKHKKDFDQVSKPRVF